MSCCDTTGLLSITDAIERMKTIPSNNKSLLSIEIDSAFGHVLAEDVISSVQVPPQDNSAMDGYAVNNLGCNDDHVYTIVGNVLAGQVYQDTLGPGECVRIMTGASIPCGTQAVVMQEYAIAQQQQVTFNKKLTPGAHIRRAGEDIANNQIILTAGTVLGAAQLGLLSATGHDTVNVALPLTVGIFATGDELLTPKEQPKTGHIYESNRIVCTSKLRALGCRVIDFGIVADTKAALIQTFDNAAQQCDIVITSGGVSVGDADFVKEVLVENGQIDFWKIAIKPGKPFAFGQYRNKVFFGLPGNPVASFVTFDVLVAPIIKHMQGQKNTSLITLTANCNSDIHKRGGRADYQRGYVWHDNGQLNVKSAGAQGSHILSSLSQANAYIVLNEHQETITAGDSVSVILFDSIYPK